MADYIDREEAKSWIVNWLRNDKYWNPYSKGKNIPTAEVFDVLSQIPAADVQPVKHGRWKWSEGGQCSECGFHNSNFGYNYCPNCGAKMDAED